jgi:hypothetical protein
MKTANLSDKAIRNFLESIKNDSEISSIRYVHEHLDRGETLDEIFKEGSDNFYFDSEQIPTKSPYQIYTIHFGSHSGGLLVDGGRWKVLFDDDGNVVDCKKESNTTC